MAIYTVHIRASGPKPNLAVVKDGFSLWAAVFGFVWALFIGAWDVAIALFIIQSAATALIPLLIHDPQVQGFAQFGMAVAVGFAANELRRVLLSWRGFEETSVAIAPDVEQAERRYFDTHPDVTIRMLGAMA